MDNFSKNREMISTLLKWKWIYLAVAFASILLGIIVAISLPKKYTAKVMLAPESNNGSNSLGNLSNIASSFGVNVNGNSPDAIAPQFYPNVVISTNFIVGLCNIQVTSIDGKLRTSLYDYCANHQKSPWWFVGKGRQRQHLTKRINAFRLTKEQDDVIESIKGMVACSYDEQSNIITIKSTSQDPLIATTLVDSMSEHLQKFITNYRTSKVRKDVEDIKQLVAEAKQKYQKAQDTYAAYCDANEDANLQSFISKRNEMENEMQLRYNIYNQLIQQQQLALAKLQERTPVYAVIQPATVPVKHSSPHKALIVILFFITGMFSVTSIALIKSQIVHQKA